MTRDSYVVGLFYRHPLIRWALERILSGDPAITVTPVIGGGAPREFDAVVTDSPLPVCVQSRVPDGRVVLLGPDDRISPHEVIASVRAVLGAPVAGDGRREARLSERERQVLQHIAAGLTQHQVARRLQISPHTVDTYVRRIRKKVGPGNKAHLTRAGVLQLM